MLFRVLKRTSTFGALFICAGLNSVNSDCRASIQSIGSAFTFDVIEKVYDGDTVRLEDGGKIRLIGINTPELGRDGSPDQPYAVQAKSRLRQLVNSTNRKVGVLMDNQKKDRFGRTLAHLFLPDSTNISALLLREGLGWHIAVTPNTEFLECYAREQQEARAKKLGVWKNPDIIDAASLKLEDTGFQLITGRVVRAGESRRHVWLNLPFNFSIRIDREDLKYFISWRPEELLHKRIETSGWIYAYNGKGKRELRMQVHHPAVIRVIR